MDRTLLKKHLNFIYLLGETNSSPQRKALLATITKEQFRVLTLVLYNIVHMKIATQKADVRRLKRYKHPLIVITDKKVGVRRRLHTLKHNPAAVGLLIKAALPGIKSALAEK